MMLLGAMGLAGFPLFGTFFGESRIDDALGEHRLSAMAAVIMISGALTSAAVLRVTARIFLGWGEREDNGHAQEAPRIPMKRETEGHPRRVPVTMWLPAALLLALSLTVAAVPAFRDAVEQAAHAMQDTRGYQALVLHGQWMGQHYSIPTSHEFPSIWRELLVFAAAIGLALWSLFPSALGQVGRAVEALSALIVRPLRAIHSGRIGDYVAWFLFGIAAYGGYLLLA